MKSRKFLPLAAVSCLLVAGAASAAPTFEYTFLEGGYASLDNGRNDDSGIQIGGSLNLGGSVALIGEYVDAGDYSQLSAGGLFHTSLSSAWDLNLGATFESIDLGPVDDTGIGLRAGLRWRDYSGRFQVEPGLRVIDIFDDTATSARLTALYEIAPHLDLRGAIQGGDDDRIELGVRYDFGR